MKKIRIAEISIVVALIISMMTSIVSFGVECNEIRKDVLRLHILANSDSEADQLVKLKVRDVLLNSGESLFSGNIDINTAEECLNLEKENLIKAANKVLDDNGFNYKTQIYIVEEYFATRTYENFTLPAGKYKSLKVVLGKGEGYNWWCVMFPPLCLPAASENTNLDIVLGESSAKLIQNKGRYKMQFKIVEIFEKIRAKMT